jgi:hypothetical protein
MPQRVRTDRFGDPGPFGDAHDDPGGSVSIEPLSGGAAKDRPLQTLTDREVEAAGRAASGMVTILPPLRNTERVQWRVRCPSR